MHPASSPYFLGLRKSFTRMGSIKRTVKANVTGGVMAGSIPRLVCLSWSNPLLPLVPDVPAQQIACDIGE